MNGKFMILSRIGVVGILLILLINFFRVLEFIVWSLESLF